MFFLFCDIFFFLKLFTIEKFNLINYNLQTNEKTDIKKT